jgi:hypothetical protein
MKNTRYIPFLPLLLASLVLASSTMAQTIEDQRTETNISTIDSIEAARSPYTQTSDISPDTSNPTLAQSRRGGPGRPFPTQRGYPRQYQTPWMDHGNAGHIVVGAAIGFAVGAALGASQSARNGTPVSGGIIFGGGIFSLLGGCVGKAVGDMQGLRFSSAPRRRSLRPAWPEDDEESNLQSHSKSRKSPTAEQTASARPATPSAPNESATAGPPSSGAQAGSAEVSGGFELSREP